VHFIFAHCTVFNERINDDDNNDDDDDDDDDENSRVTTTTIRDENSGSVIDAFAHNTTDDVP